VNPSLFALYASLAISLGAGGPRLERAQLDPWLLLRSPGTIDLPWQKAAGLTVPGVVWASTDKAAPDVVEHEAQHVRQLQALGPIGLSAAYAMTGGRAFEDFLGSMWEPPPTRTPDYPLISWTPDKGVALWGIPVGGANDAAERTTAVADLHAR
jgi:hypothetical protein